jgi:magnesium-transporting ATPase (P-type)
MHEKQILYSYYPKMYQISQKNQLFTHLTFLSWYVLGIFQGVICLILTLYAIGDQDDSSGINSH